MIERIQEHWVLETDRTVIETLQGLAWMMPAFFRVALIAYVIDIDYKLIIKTIFFVWFLLIRQIGMLWYLFAIQSIWSYRTISLINENYELINFNYY